MNSYISSTKFGLKSPFQTCEIQPSLFLSLNKEKVISSHHLIVLSPWHASYANYTKKSSLEGSLGPSTNTQIRWLPQKTRYPRPLPKPAKRYHWLLWKEAVPHLWYWKSIQYRTEIWHHATTCEMRNQRTNDLYIASSLPVLLWWEWQKKLSQEFTLENSVPQDSLIFINSITSVIPTPIKTRLFADYLNITLQSNNLDFAENLLQSRLNNVSKWSDHTGQKILNWQNHRSHLHKETKPPQRPFPRVCWRGSFCKPTTQQSKINVLWHSA